MKWGSLFIIFSVKDYLICKVKGSDIYADLPLALDELVLGANISLKSPKGDTCLLLPPGSFLGQNLKLEGQVFDSLDYCGHLLIYILSFN